MSEVHERLLNQQREFIKVFSTPEGERVLADILHEAGFMKQAAVADPVSLGMAMGRRNLAVWILNMLNRDLNSLPEIRHHLPRR